MILYLLYLVRATVEWPQNDHIGAGAVVQLAYVGLEDGSCVVDLPESVDLFHVSNLRVSN